MKIRFGSEERLEAHTYCLEVVHDTGGATLEDIASTMRETLSSQAKLYEHMTSAGAALLLAPLVEKKVIDCALTANVPELIRWSKGYVANVPDLDMEFRADELFYERSLDALKRFSKADTFSRFMTERVQKDSLYVVDSDQAYAQLAEGFERAYPDHFA